MSGLQKSTGRKTFVNIKEGKLIVKRQKDGPIEEYGSLTGMLTGIEITTKEYQGQQYEQLSLHVSADGDAFELQMRFDSGYGRGFCYTIMNADVTKPIKFSPKFSEKDGKKESWLFLNQFDQPLLRFFTKDHPNGLPPMTKTTFKGKDMWDNTDQLVFWKRMINEKIRPKLLHPAIAENDIDTVKKELPNPEDITEPIDDLPF